MACGPPLMCKNLLKYRKTIPGNRFGTGEAADITESTLVLLYCLDYRQWFKQPTIFMAMQFFCDKNVLFHYSHIYSLLIFCSSVNHTAPDFELTMEKPSEHDKQKYSDTEEMRGCRQINELSIETLTFEGLRCQPALCVPSRSPSIPAFFCHLLHAQQVSMSDS